jgi:hypothetical protein
MAIILAILVVKLLTPVKLKATIYGAISGQVVTEDTKKGLKDVTVNLCFINMQLITETKTDENGRFSFDIVKEGQYLLLFFPNPDSGYYVDIPNTRWEIPGRTIVNVEKGKHVVVKREALIGGTALIKIIKRDGTRFIPPPDRPIRLNTGGEIVESYLTPEVPDSEGNYLARGLPPDTYWFDAEIDGYASQRIENIRIEKGKTTEVNFIIDLGDPTGIEGKIISSIDGGPIYNVIMGVDQIINEKRIGVSPLGMSTDETGYFSLVGLVPGRCIVYYGNPLEAEHLLKKEVIITEGKKTWLDLKLDIPSNVKKKIAIQANRIETLSTSINKEGLPKGLKNIFDCDGKKLTDDIRRNLQGHIIKAVQQGLNGNCLPSIAKESFERNLKNFFVIRYGCKSAIGCGRTFVGLPTYIDIFNDIWTEETKNLCGSPEAIIFHELLHFTTTGMYEECITHACTKQCYPYSTPPLDDSYGIYRGNVKIQTDDCLKKDGRWQCCDEDIKEKNRRISGKK